MRVQFVNFILALSFIYCWKPKFVGHRGSIKGVENTVESFRNGADLYKFDGLECDVRVTADNQYVISHNKFIIGMNGIMDVELHTLEELKSNKLFQIRNFHLYFGYICTVEEYLQIVAEKNLFPVIELKPTNGINGKDMSKFEGLLNLVRDYGLESKAIFISFMRDSIEYIISYHPELKVQYLMDFLTDSNFEWCVENKVNPGIKRISVTMENTEALHSKGLLTGIWTANGMDNYKYYGPMGVYTYTSDNLNVTETEELPKRWPDLPDLSSDIDGEKLINRNLNFLKFLNE